MIFGVKDTGSLGDCCYLLAAVQELNRRGEKCIVQMHTDQQSREVSVVFDELAEVVFTDNPVPKLYENNREKHAAQIILDKLNISNINCIPKISLKQEEMSWAEDFLKDYKNPIIVLNDNSGSHDLTNTGAQYKRPPIEIMQAICNYLISKNHTVLQFGRKENDKFTPLENAAHIRGLNIRQLAACYRVIGKLVSSDTGDYHLLLSVGGKCVVLQPEESERYGFIYKSLRYSEECWKDEKIRVRYVDFHNPDKALKEYLNFDW